MTVINQGVIFDPGLGSIFTVHPHLQPPSPYHSAWFFQALSTRRLPIPVRIGTKAAKRALKCCAKVGDAIKRTFNGAKVSDTGGGQGGSLVPYVS